MQLSFRNRPSKNNRNLKKPAAPAPHAPATVLFPGFAVPAKAGGIVTLCPRKDVFKIKKADSHGPVLRTCLGRPIRSTYCPAFVRSRGQTPNAAKAGGIVTPCTGNQRFKIKKPAATYFPAFAVSSAQRCLTSVFGMGTGIATSPWPPASITMPALVGSGLWKPGSFGLVVQSVSGMHSRYAQHKVKR